MVVALAGLIVTVLNSSVRKYSVRREEKQLVSAQRAADAGARLLLPEVRPEARGVIRIRVGEEVVRRKRAVTNVVEAAAGDLVRARFQNRVHDAAARPAVLRREVARHHLEFLHCVERRLREEAADGVVVVVDAVENRAVITRAAPTKRVAAAGCGALGGRARRREDEPQRVAHVDGQLLDRPLVHLRAHVGLARLDHAGGLAHDDDALRYRRHLQLNRDVRALVEGHRHLREGHLREAAQLRRHGVAARLQAHGQAGAIPVRHECPRDAGRVRGDGHGHAGHERPGLVGHDDGNIGGDAGCLRGTCRRHPQEDEEQGNLQETNRHESFNLSRTETSHDF